VLNFELSRAFVAVDGGLLSRRGAAQPDVVDHQPSVL